jgi:hypothetical protein
MCLYHVGCRKGRHTPNPLSPHIHPISSGCLVGWTTSMILLSWRPCRFNVRRILLLFPEAWKAQSSGSFDSDRCEVLARDGWSLHVSLHIFPAYYATLNSPCPAGSSSLLLTTNGESSGVISPTGGRYGSVLIDASLGFYLPCCALGLIRSFCRFIPSHVWPLLWA